MSSNDCMSVGVSHSWSVGLSRGTVNTMSSNDCMSVGLSHSRSAGSSHGTVTNTLLNNNWPVVTVDAAPCTDCSATRSTDVGLVIDFLFFFMSVPSSENCK